MRENVPYHVAIIMDGNGRWARNRGLPRNLGHRKGMEVVEKVIACARQRGIKMLTLFAFSTENWDRPKLEIEFLFSSLKGYLRRKKKKLIKEGMRLNVMGRREGLPSDLLLQIDELVSCTKDNTVFTLNIALNYGGRAEIIDAVKNIVKDVKQKKFAEEDLTEDNFRDFIYSPFIPDIDLLIRTSGEQRISNFLLWRLAYSELYFTKTLWPDFGSGDLDKAIEEFNKRERRFGGAG